MSFLEVLLAVLFVGSVVVALTFWNEILDWATDTLLPWIKENIPGLKDYVTDALVALDQVITPIRNKAKALKMLTEIKEAWKMLREYLLKILVQYERKTSSKWVKRIIYWIRSNLKSKEVKQIVIEQTVDADSLQGEVRKEWLKRNNTTQEIDLTQLRDQELRERKLDELDMSN